MTPVRSDEKGKGSVDVTTCFVFPPVVDPVEAVSSAAGVPARAAQSEPSGPLTTQTTIASSAVAIALIARARRPSPLGQAVAIRQPTATRTTARQEALIASIQTSDASVPEPRPWTSASGQQA